MADEDTPLEAGLGFAVRLNKENFLGREVLVEQKHTGVKKRLVQFALEDPEILLYHNEPIWRDNEIVGFITSGMFGHTLGAAIGLGYVNHADGVTPEYIQSGRYEIEVSGRRIPARASLRPFYDPENKRIKI